MVEKTHGFEHLGEGPLWEALGALVEKTQAKCKGLTRSVEKTQAKCKGLTRSFEKTQARCKGLNPFRRKMRTRAAQNIEGHHRPVLASNFLMLKRIKSL